MNFGRGFLAPKRPTTPRERIAHAARCARVGAAPRGERIELARAEVHSQGTSQACMGFALEQGVFVHAAATWRPRPFGAPGFAYWCFRRGLVVSDADVTDTGSDPYAAVDAVREFGSPPWADCPFDAERVNAKPPEVAFVPAQRTRPRLTPILELGERLPAIVDHVIRIERKPVLVALSVNAAFEKYAGGVLGDASGGDLGGHANLIRGREGDTSLDVNSWGATWGEGGEARISDAYLARRCVWAASVEVLP